MTTYNGSNADDKYSGGIGDDYYNVGEGNNTVFDLGGRNFVNAGSGNDTITMGDGDDQINAGDGLNVIAAGGGRNMVNAGSGADFITSGSGDDQINAGEGNNTVDAGDGRNTVNAGSGNDSITTGSGDDQINAGNGNNIVRAGDGRNMVNSGSGDDFIVTGSGDDQINAGDGKNTIDAGDGRNMVNTGSGADSITTGSGDDQINAGEGNNVINAGAGNNRVTAGSGNDTITAGAGNNEIYAGEGNNTVTLGAGNSRVYTGSGADTITLGAGNNEVYAGEGNNTVSVAGGNNRIYTGSGADIITTGAGNDTIFAGGGNDRVILGGGSDLVFLGDGNDVARLTLAQSKGGAHIDLWGEGGSDTLQLVLNTAEAQDATVLADIQGFQKHLAGDGNWMYQFKTADIAVRQFEKLEIVAPVLAAADKATTTEDAPVSIQVLANDKDLLAASNAALHVTELVTTGLQGTATISADGRSVAYDPGQAFQYLKAGEQADVTFQYKVADDQGFVDTASVTVTVTGVDDAATISGNAAGTVKEDGVLKAAGTLAVSDLDAGQSHFADVAASALHGTYGDFTFNDGAWDYTLRNGDAKVQALAEGQRVSDTLTVKSLDGSAQTVITVTVAGTNDAPVVTADAPSNTLVEATAKNPGTDTSTVHLHKGDVDGAASYDLSGWTQVGTSTSYSKDGLYGTATLDTTSDTLVYHLDNTRAATDKLTSADVKSDHFDVRVHDDAATPLNATVGVDFVVHGTTDSDFTKVGYYDMVAGQGQTAEGRAISAVGLTPVNLQDVSASSLQGLSSVVVYNPNNSGYGAEFLRGLSDLQKWVQDGGHLVIFDRYVDNAESILPGIGNAQIVRSFSEGIQLNFVNDSGEFAKGPGGNLNDASLDNYNYSNHGFSLAGTLPTGATLIQTTDNASHVTTFGYGHGAGEVVYSSIPLDVYLGGGTMGAYAQNVMSWLGHGGDLLNA